MGDHSSRLADLRRAVLDSPGRSEPAVRAAAAGGHQLPPPLDSYIAKVRSQSYRIGDSDVDTLKLAGLGEDEIFEVTVAAALGAGLRSLEAGLRAMRDEA